MSWKYVNPGDYRLLNKYSNVYNYIGSRDIAPYTGMSFYHYATANYPISVPEGIRELWGKFCVFSGAGSSSSSNNDSLILAQSTYNSTRHVNFNLRNNLCLFYLYPNSNTGVGSTKTFESGVRIHEVYFHVKSDSIAGIVEAYDNGLPIVNITGRNVLAGDDIKIYTLRTYYTGSSFSDIILSDEPIDMNEHCAVVPIKTTTAEGWNYNADSNIYTTDSASRTIWQMPDVAQFKKEIGVNNPTITSVSTQVFNANTNDTETVDTLKKQVKQNNTIVDTDSATISGTAVRFLSPALMINPVTNTAWTINDLNNIELGITTAKSE